MNLRLSGRQLPACRLKSLVKSFSVSLHVSGESAVFRMFSDEPHLIVEWRPYVTYILSVPLQGRAFHPS